MRIGMHEELVLDASVAAKCFITEEGSEAARRAVAMDRRLLAPDLLFLQVAGVAARRARLGDIGEDLAAEIVHDAPGLVDEVTPTSALVERAFEFVLKGFTPSEGVYLALAVQRSCAVLTADTELLLRAQDAGLSALVVTP